MSVTRNMMFNVYAGGVAAITTVVAHQVVQGLWRSVTGEEPPEPNDPATPSKKALTWVLANAVGIGVLGVLANRFAASRWEQFSGAPVRSTRSVSLRL